MDRLKKLSDKSQVPYVHLIRRLETSYEHIGSPNSLEFLFKYLEMPEMCSFNPQPLPLIDFSLKKGY